MFYQNDEGAPKDFQKYACLFSVLYHSKEFIQGEIVHLDEAVLDWTRARERGLVSGDLNRDGDFDDVGEDEILDYNGLCLFLHLPIYFPPQTKLPTPLVSLKKDIHGVSRMAPTKDPWPQSYYVVERWEWKYSHFVLGSGTGMRPVKYDPIRGGSYTVSNGKCADLRVFEIRR